MKWSRSQVSRLKELCYQGVSNKEIAANLGCSLNDVYAKRSQLGITIAKCAKEKSIKSVTQDIKKEHLDELRDAFKKVWTKWANKYGYVPNSRAVVNVGNKRLEVTL